MMYEFGLTVGEESLRRGSYVVDFYMGGYKELAEWAREENRKKLLGIQAPKKQLIKSFLSSILP